MPVLMKVDAVHYRYRSSAPLALDDVSLAARRGAVLGIVGPNGSGKTTLYRLILGLMRPDSGKVTLDRIEPAVYRTRRGIGYLPEHVQLPGRVRVRRFAEFTARLAGLEGVSLSGSIDRLMAVLGLEERAGAEIGTLSHGYRQRVGLLAALLGDPRLLLFDEPGNGLDPTSIGILRSLVRGLKREGRTVLVSSHNLLELERMCDEIVILHEGKLIGRSSREELATRPGIWVVQLSAGSARANSLRKKFDGVRLADDEAAFLEEMNARRYATHVELSGGSVEALERRPYDLECLYHELVQDQANEASVE